MRLYTSAIIGVMGYIWVIYYFIDLLTYYFHFRSGIRAGTRRITRVINYPDTAAIYMVYGSGNYNFYCVTEQC